MLDMEQRVWMEPDVCVLEPIASIQVPLIQLVGQILNNQVPVACILDAALGSRLLEDLTQMYGARGVARGIQMLPSSGLTLEEVADRLRDRLEKTRRLHLVHDVSWAARAGYSTDDLLAYFESLHELTVDHRLRTIHVYPPEAFDGSARWRLLRAHRSVWTGATICDNFYYTPQATPPPPGLDVLADVERNLAHLSRQGRLQVELVGLVTQTQSMIEARLREQNATHRLVQIMAQAGQMEDVMEEALIQLMELLGMDAGSVYVQPLDVELRIELPGDSVTPEELRSFHQGLVSSNAHLADGRVAWSNDVLEVADAGPKAGIRSYVAANLGFAGRAFGTIEVVGRHPHSFSLQEIHLVSMVANQLSLSVENARLLELSRRADGLEQELQQKRFEADMVPWVGHLMSRIGHDVNNPLTSVLGFARLLKEEADDDQEREALQTIYQEAHKASRVLSLTCGGARKRSAHRVEFDLNLLVSGIVSDWRADFEQKHVRVALTLAPGMPPCVGDPAHIRHLLLQLMANSMQAMHDFRQKGRLSIGTRCEGSNLILEVKDDGAGIDEEIMPRVLQPFVTSRPGSATGLGLAICDSIAREHEGTLSIQSVPGQGTSVVVVLPARDPGPAAVAAAPGAPAAKGRRILVIDDDAAVRNLLCRTLKRARYQVEDIDSATEALRRLDDAACDLVVCDMNMPGMSGAQIYDASRRASHAVPFLFVTGDTLSPDTQEFFERTHTAFLAKPFESEELLTMAAEVLAGRGTAAGSRRPAGQNSGLQQGDAIAC